MSYRAPGSTGMCQDPGKVLKGKKMPGRMREKDGSELLCMAHKPAGILPDRVGAYAGGPETA